MSVRLVRENSDTPNVTNKDDARMVRYAYGGQNGYVQKYGRELDYIPNGNIFTIGSGMAVLQGWEVVIDSNGWQLELSTSDVTKRYYLVYLEVNLTLGGSAEIKSKTDELDYPTIEEGDDLTENLNGIAHLELYRFTATRGVIGNVEKIVQAIPYGADEVSGLNGKINVINQRLQNLGFKQGYVAFPYNDGGITLRRQGNYVLATIKNYGRYGSLGEALMLPDEFRPIRDLQFSIGAKIGPLQNMPDIPGAVPVVLRGNLLQVRTFEYFYYGEIRYSSSARIENVQIGWEAMPIREV